MSVSVDSGGGKAVDVDINLVPFIDLMSCLVAFLLVTAAWTNLAQMPVKPKGVGRDAEKQLNETPPINISILVAQDATWVGLTTGERQQFKKNGEDHDWEGIQKALSEYKNNSGFFKERQDIEVAAEDGVNYQAIITAMDSAITNGFPDVGFVDPNSLSVKFKQ